MTNTHEISVKECISFGWKTFKSRPYIFILVGIIIFLTSMAVDFPQKLTEDMHGALGISLGIITFLLSAGLSFLISMGKTSFFLRAHDSVESVEIRNLWHPQPYLKFVGASVLAGAAVILGLILLIVPGIILGIMFSFSLYIVIEKGVNPIEALKESAELTKGHRWNLFLLGLALLGINILGFLALIVGLAVSLPISTLAVVHAYRTLSNKEEGSVTNEIEAVA